MANRPSSSQPEKPESPGDPKKPRFRFGARSYGTPSSQPEKPATSGTPKKPSARSRGRLAATPASGPSYTRKHQSRMEREADQRRLVVLGTAAVIGLVALILAAGALYSALVEPSQAMAQVEDQKITRQEFYRRVNYERFRLARVIRDTRGQADEMLADPEMAGFYYQFMEQQLGQLQSAYVNLPNSVLEQMIEERVVEKDAAARNITVSDEEVDEQVRREMAQQSNALIESDVTATAEAQVQATQTAAGFTPTPTPSPSPTVTATAEPTGTQTTVPLTPTVTLGPTVTPGPTFTPEPTPTPNILSEDLYGTTYTTFLDEMRSQVGYSETDYRNIVRVGLLRDKLEEVVGSETEVETTEPYVHVAHILVASQEEATAALARVRGGEDFAVVAAELSTDEGSKVNGGELDWAPRSGYVAPFADAAFALTEPGQISEPVQSEFGWHIIKLLEPQEPRPLAESAIDEKKAEAFRTYLLDKKGQYNIDRFWNLRDLPRDPFGDEVLQPLPTLVPTVAAPAIPTVPLDLTTPDAAITPEVALPGATTPEAATTPAAAPAGATGTP